ncbi:Crystal ET79 [Fusarium sp. NRRL 52700]|nr:Crystal ET79 [Fusarium sp. NRRL 52700]
MAPSRSTHCTIVNNTSLTLNLKSSGCHHGRWTLNFGPSDTANTIPTNDRKSFQAESAGVMTGDQGWATYSSSAGEFTFNFNNPFSGSNDYSESGPPGYSIKRDGGSGDDARVTWTIQYS